MTSPHIGNTGINSEDPESVSGAPQVAGFVVRDLSPAPSNWRSERTLEDYLAESGIVAIDGVDTRKLTRHLRDHGAQNGCIGTESPDVLVDRARSAPSMQGLDLVARVSPKQAYDFTESRGAWQASMSDGAVSSRVPVARDYRVVAIDFGAKRNILRCLVDSGCKVHAVPASTSAADILKLDPDGIFLSNGPGDPAAVGYAIRTIRELVGKKPIFGICLGHQLLSLALGGSTYKLKFGHRGGNHPVKELETGKVEITSQNHGFAVDPESLPPGVTVTHVNLEDGTVEGLRHETKPVFCVQYHPEAAPGPHDADYLFRQFLDEMEKRA
ncbi:MAG: glutamine-hydrolyzing carbamoyl-phosphate synthase small subunit [Burkholderiales bacterium]